MDDNLNEFGLVMRPIKKIAENFTCLILKKNIPEASGVFVKYNNFFFVISSAHQFWENEKTDFYFVYQTKIFPLIGYQIYNNKESNPAIDFDYSITKLSDSIIAEMDKNDFYDLNIDLRFYEKSIINYFFSGFLVNKVKVGVKGKKIERFKYAFNDLIEGKELGAFFYIQFNRRKSFLKANRSIAPIPKGCSGTGIWANVDSEPILIGLLLEYDPKDCKIKALKIQFIVNRIIEGFK